MLTISQLASYAGVTVPVPGTITRPACSPSPNATTPDTAATTRRRRAVDPAAAHAGEEFRNADSASN
ncbi:hypothetical protein [Pseudarthrobacter sp. NIBRBAC000502772]|uniref:hypothetical protein n=1 Tax=Pseudarthrobacter sp. NIBRBAC000502772 TaxID=2590775 RepID=UPI001FEF1799|nr:hypothetical protein [Pseudarthrobacter sp. NIBRBAC000502772]